MEDWLCSDRELAVNRMKETIDCQSNESLIESFTMKVGLSLLTEYFFAWPLSNSFPRMAFEDALVLDCGWRQIKHGDL